MSENWWDDLTGTDICRLKHNSMPFMCLCSRYQDAFREMSIGCFRNPRECLNEDGFWKYDSQENVFDGKVYRLTPSWKMPEKSKNDEIIGQLRNVLDLMDELLNGYVLRQT